MGTRRSRMIPKLGSGFVKVANRTANRGGKSKFKKLMIFPKRRLSPVKMSIPPVQLSPTSSAGGASQTVAAHFLIRHRSCLDILCSCKAFKNPSRLSRLELDHSRDNGRKKKISPASSSIACLSLHVDICLPLRPLFIKHTGAAKTATDRLALLETDALGAVTADVVHHRGRLSVEVARRAAGIVASRGVVPFAGHYFVLFEI